jgi:hypothetical protein
MPVRERELGELPSPICPCLTARSGRDLLFSAGAQGVLIFILILIVILIVILILLILILLIRTCFQSRTAVRTAEREFSLLAAAALATMACLMKFRAEVVWRRAADGDHPRSDSLLKNTS